MEFFGWSFRDYMFILKSHVLNFIHTLLPCNLDSILSNTLMLFTSGAFCVRDGSDNGILICVKLLPLQDGQSVKSDRFL